MWPRLNLAFFVELEFYQTAGRYRPRSERFGCFGEEAVRARLLRMRLGMGAGYMRLLRRVVVPSQDHPL
jgi:hypothetical protein